MSDKSSVRQDDAVIPALTAANFHSTVKDCEGPLLVLVKAGWCHHCDTQLGILRGLLREKQDDLSIYTLSADNERELLKALKIFGVPTLLYYRHGLLVRKKVGVHSAGKVTAILDEIRPWSPDETKAHRHRGLLEKLLGKRESTKPSGS
ncbi:MAG: thioredoxin family protein [FCB group bacterium]|nr:thioredoxin family protein [FCB group bacterium]